ncbi:DUF1116 domain-containing protein [Mesorhizobium sp. BAC0120]|uniref:DUF1116 domain-containing protein n=1 Tax=Mesorhizobium sp. BAC0120 TaxID=3090670 RepID=UPI00298D2A8B|nr:DUF1116 domain-containing protein [Mesorhizobium sp. BAC0120]MDW6023195.1 DUF1116 domain-containing protein [Mesorhizobium sp. BAC0120]
MPTATQTRRIDVDREAASSKSIEALNTTAVVLERVCAACEATSKVGPRSFLHAGPPIELANIPGPMRGAIIGGLLFEGEAKDVATAEQIIDSGEIELTPCHHAGGLGAMAGIITPNMPVAVAQSNGRLTFAPLNEGTDGAVRYGSFDDKTLARLKWMSTDMVAVLNEAVQANPIDLVDLVAEGLRRGDDCHNRLVGTTANLIVRFAPSFIRSKHSAAAEQVAAFMAGNGHFALPFAIIMAKALTLAASDIANSPIVTAMSANGREFGIRVSGTGDRWFVAPSPIGEPKLVPGVTMDDLTPTMGDSMISETAGFGAFAMTAAPAIMSFVGGTAAQARALVEEMRSISAGTSSRFLIPAEEHRGSPVGIDVHRVAQTGIAPVINNGLAHRLPGRGRAGAGITRVPIEPFIAASEALRAGTVA